MSEIASYEAAYEELQKIVSEIEQGEISVDSLSEKVKRAAVLIAFCKSKLQSTEADVNEILAELDSSKTDNAR
ncbi:MAG: exodeoxyribonuclease VII small subunit [Flavobacterium sp.]|nr:exodeoxyribonuclease VII small subunit [Flavobacterium sp.]